MSRVPLVEVPQAQARRIAALGGRPLNLYRALANQPDLLNAWVEFAYALRLSPRTARELRELMILRTAQLHQSDYEWAQHVRMARDAYVPSRQIEALARWRSSGAFDAREKAALALTEAIVQDRYDDLVHEEVRPLFSPPEFIELALTASFYCLVPRLLKALEVPIEHDDAPHPSNS